MTLRRAARRRSGRGWPRARAARTPPASRSSGTRSSRSRPPAWCSACWASACPSGNRKEARSAAFALSIAVIFVYYVLIRLGEQAGDTGLMPPFLVDVGRQPRARGRRHRPPRPQPSRGRLRPPRRPPLSGAPSRGCGARSRLRRRAAKPRTRGTTHHGGGAHPPDHPSLPLPDPARPLHRARATSATSLLVLAAFLSIYVLAHFMDLFDDIQQHHVRGRVVLHFYLFYSVAIVHIVAPVAVLVAVLVTFGVLARRNEVTAMKAGGLSIYRIAAPLLAMGLLAQRDPLRAAGVRASHHEPDRRPGLQRHQGPAAPGLEPARSALDPRQRRPLLQLRLPRASARTAAEAGAKTARSGRTSRSSASPSTTSTPRPGSCASVSIRRRASWNARAYGYDLDRGCRLTPASQPSLPHLRPGAGAGPGPRPGGELEPPRYFKREDQPSDTMTFDELRRHIASVEALGFDAVPLEVQLQRKLSFPMVGFIMTLLGVPFSFVVARRGALYGIGISIIIAIVYWALPRHLRGPRRTTRSCLRSSPPGPRTCSSARPAST